MSKTLLIFVLGIIFGTLLVIIGSKDQTYFYSETPCQTPANSGDLLTWEQIKSIPVNNSVTVKLRGRLWTLGSVLLLPSTSSLESWSRHEELDALESHGIPVQDAEFFTQEWWVKKFAGAESEITCRFHRQALENERIGVIESIKDVKLLSGLPCDFASITREPRRFHDLVIRIYGVIGNHPTLDGLFLYPSMGAYQKHDHTQALLLEKRFGAAQPKKFDLLANAGTELVVDGLFNGPWKDDAMAPLGRIVLIHQIFRPEIQNKK